MGWGGAGVRRIGSAGGNRPSPFLAWAGPQPRQGSLSRQRGSSWLKVEPQPPQGRRVGGGVKDDAWLHRSGADL